MMGLLTDIPKSCGQPTIESTCRVRKRKWCTYLLRQPKKSYSNRLPHPSPTATYNPFTFVHIYRKNPLVDHVPFLVSFQMPLHFASAATSLHLRLSKKPRVHTFLSLPPNGAYSVCAPSQLEPFVSAPSSNYPILPAHPPPLLNLHPSWMATPKRPSCKSHLSSHMQGVHTLSVVTTSNDFVSVSSSRAQLKPFLSAMTASHHSPPILN